jgi:hypothetical protein
MISPRVQSWNEASEMGDLFKLLTPVFIHYKPFYNGYGKANELLDKFQEEESIKELLNVRKTLITIYP